MTKQDSPLHITQDLRAAAVDADEDVSDILTTVKLSIPPTLWFGYNIEPHAHGAEQNEQEVVCCTSTQKIQDSGDVSVLHAVGINTKSLMCPAPSKNNDAIHHNIVHFRNAITY